MWIWIKQDLKQNVIYIVFTFLLCGDQCGVIDKYTLMYFFYNVSSKSRLKHPQHGEIKAK